MVCPARRTQASTEQGKPPFLAGPCPSAPAHLPRRGPDPISRARTRRNPAMRKEALLGVCAVFGTILGIGVLCLRGEGQ